MYALFSGFGLKPTHVQHTERAQQDPSLFLCINIMGTWYSIVGQYVYDTDLGQLNVDHPLYTAMITLYWID